VGAGLAFSLTVSPLTSFSSDLACFSLMTTARDRRESAQLARKQARALRRANLERAANRTARLPVPGVGQIVLDLLHGISAHQQAYTAANGECSRRGWRFCLELEKSSLCLSGCAPCLSPSQQTVTAPVNASKSIECRVADGL
jgi:hypothetical protein